jgi:hypothetical protein
MFDKIESLLEQLKDKLAEGYSFAKKEAISAEAKATYWLTIYPLNEFISEVKEEVITQAETYLQGLVDEQNAAAEAAATAAAEAANAAQAPAPMASIEPATEPVAPAAEVPAEAAPAAPVAVDPAPATTDPAQQQE